MCPTMQCELPDCTDRCKSTQHGDLITAAITKRSISDTDLCSYLTYICTCCESVRDSMGRTALHMAASCGRVNLVRWLVQCRHANIGEKDKESGYTALHRAIFYGKIDVVVELLKLGANINVLDLDNFTIFEHAMKDNTISVGDSGELYVWGLNNNNSLGPQHARTTPELLDVFHKEFPNENIQQICLSQFHSIIITKSGKAFSCGHGLGGRLGLGKQLTILIPTLINFCSENNRSTIKIRLASISRDHSMFLDMEGNVYTCGLNTNRVLGISPPPNELLLPKKVKQLTEEIVGIVAGTYHSVAWNSTSLYTWGYNGGQLGYTYHENVVIIPKTVNVLPRTFIIIAADTSGYATAVCGKNGDIYVFHEHIYHKVSTKRDSKLFQISITGGKLSSEPESQNNSNKILRMVILTKDGDLLYWEEPEKGCKNSLYPCFFSLNRTIFIKQVVINPNEILFVTSEGQAFYSRIKPKKGKNFMIEQNTLTKYSKEEDTILIKLTRFPNIFRAVNIQSDFKGNNYCVIQASPFQSEFTNDVERKSEIKNDLLMLLLETIRTNEETNDMINFKIKYNEFLAHRYIVSHSSSYFAHKISELSDNNIIKLDDIDPNIFQEFLLYCYTGNCNILENERNKNILSTSDCNEKNPNKSSLFRKLREFAKKYECLNLENSLKHLNKIMSFGFDRTKFPEFYDVTIKCQNGVKVKAHKCILMARVEYFRNLFSTRWLGDEKSSVSLPFPVTIVTAFLDFLYTNTFQTNNKELDYYFKIIILADQLFVQTLKEKCEILLTRLFTLKNITQILTFSHIYNAKILKIRCIDYISLNISNLIELCLLNDLSEDLLKEINDIYISKKSSFDYRVITPFSTAPSDEEIISISNAYPVSLDEEIEITPKTSQKRRSRSHKTSPIESNNHVKTLSPQNSIKNDKEYNIPFTDVLENETANYIIPNRLKAIKLAEVIVSNENISDNYSNLSQGIIRQDGRNTLNNLFENFPSINNRSILNPHIKSFKFDKIVKISQKERKRLSSENLDGQGSTLLAESPKNPWKILPEIPSTMLEKETKCNITDIILDEKKQKENLLKIKSKSLMHTQIEDKAIDELQKFYNVDNVTDEIIIIERVNIGTVAIPVWVSKTKN